MALSETCHPTIEVNKTGGLVIDESENVRLAIKNTSLKIVGCPVFAANSGKCKGGLPCWLNDPKSDVTVIYG